MKPRAKQRNIDYRRRVGRIVLAFFFIQAMFPAGYMPAALSSGWFLQLCPNGVSPAVMTVLHGDHHASHHDSNDTQHEAWRVDCPFSAFGPTEFTATCSGHVDFHSTAEQDYHPGETTLLLLAKLSNSNHARAPPGTTRT